MRKVLAIIVILLLGMTVFSLMMTKERSESASEAQESGTAAIGGGFTLTDQNGRQVSDTDFRGKVMLVFFGFTHCPDICPMSTLTLSKTMLALGDRADQVVPIYITVDPEQDTPEVLKDYLSNFDPHFVGLTGTLPQIKSVAAAYKAYFEKVGVPWGEDDGKKADNSDADDGGNAEKADSDDDDAYDDYADETTNDDAVGLNLSKAGQDYTLDHSAFIYMMGRDGKYVTHFPYNASAQEIADAVKKYLDHP